MRQKQRAQKKIRAAADATAWNREYIFLFLCFWLPPMAWLALSPPIAQPLRAEARTRQSLDVINQALQAYLDKFKVAPANLSELRAFAHGEGLPFQAYDAYGDRFDYVRFDQRHYVLRSFGEDGVQNTAADALDTGVINWGPKAERSPRYQYGTGRSVHLFPPQLLVAADAPSDLWTAKLFVDTDQKTRQLVVRSKNTPGLFMVAKHDAVEEFLWLSDGRKLVFTASGSARHRDGVFLWDLMNDSLTPLTELNPDGHGTSATGKSPSLNLALAGITQTKTGDEIFAFKATRRDGPMNPQEFFSAKNLAAWEVGHLPGELRNLKAPEKIANLWSEPLNLSAHVEARGGLQVQRAWAQLPMSGEAEKVLMAWHSFSERESLGPLFPYSLWILSTLYGESFAILSPVNARDADVLRTFGTEISQALLNYPLTPSYIKALAAHHHATLMSGEPLPYHLSQLESRGHIRSKNNAD